MRRSLDRAARDIRDLTKPTRAAARDVAATARRLAPKRTGRLAGGVRVSVSGGTAVISDRIRYAPFQEHGTSVMRAHPFMRPAIATTNVVDHYERHVDDAVRHI